MRHLSRMLISLLAATAFAGNTAEISSPHPHPAADNTISPVSWSQVETASGHLAFVQALTAYALTAPAEEFPSALVAVERWPQLAPPTSPDHWNFPNEPDERKIRARRTLACSFTARAPDQAVACHALAPAEVLTHFRPVFFAELTRLDLARARTELLKIPAGDERQNAASAIVIALSKTDPFVALALRKELDVTDVSAVATVFEATAQLDPHKALAALDSLPDSHRRTDARQRVLGEWILKSSDDALAWISSNIPEADRPAFLDLVLGRTGVRNFALLASIEEQTHNPLIKAAATRAISSRLVHQPVQYAWDRVLTRGWKGISREPPPNYDIPFFRTLNDLVRFASTQPPEQVRKFFRSLPAGYGEDVAQVDDIMKAWTLADPEGAIAWADKLPAGKARDAASYQGQIMLVALDPELAFTRLRTLPPGETHSRLAQATFFELAKKDLKSALTRSPLPESVLKELYGMAAVVRVASDYAPDTMIALVREASPDIFTSAFASEWLFNEPEDALAWYFAQPPGLLKTDLQEPAARALARSDPARAIDFAISMPDGSERVALIEALIDHHAVTQPAPVIALIDSLPAGGQRSSLYAQAILRLAHADPARTAAQLDAGTLGPINSHAIGLVTRMWAAESAPDCARWITPHLKPVHNDSELINNAVNQVARGYAQQDPAAAITWAGTLTDPALSQKATATAIETIARSSRNFALRLLSESTLPENQKLELASRIRR